MGDLNQIWCDRSLQTVTRAEGHEHGTGTGKRSPKRLPKTKGLRLVTLQIPVVEDGSLQQTLAQRSVRTKVHCPPPPPILYAKVGETFAVSGLPSSPSPFSHKRRRGAGNSFPSPILGEGNTRGEGDLNEICVKDSPLQEGFIVRTETRFASLG